ncbi:DUF4113 domain-containing protein [Xanthomonas cucurbitae]|uniref:DUF4113 domain-containing protein n=1 Tax=Xanthomonas cucurbitae TaxID=56453 RepID=A0ABY7YG92_9XANT|nr:DUF4113 domain-containing protein [Xanthomonas cucurbitae]WDM72854.1 DUF4113 domain-containing protein [Xanthomonas cucurbitae]
MSLDLTAGPAAQGDLFAGVDPRSKSLMDMLDKDTKKFGCGTAGFASSVLKTKPVWAMNQKSLSPASTSGSDQLLRVTQLENRSACSGKISIMKKVCRKRSKMAGSRIFASTCA